MSDQPKYHLAAEVTSASRYVKDSTERIGAVWEEDESDNPRAPHYSGVLNLGFTKVRINLFPNGNHPDFDIDAEGE